jgi:hypothetical protein
MQAYTCLNAGLLVGADHELVGAQALPLPATGVQIQDACGLGLELGIAREDPAAMLPGSDGVFVQPAPHGAIADARDQPTLFDFSPHVGHAQFVTPARRAKPAVRTPTL